MTRILVPFAAAAALSLMAGAAFAAPTHYGTGQRAEPQLTEPCIQGSLGCRADGYPDARYYRPALEGQPGVVDNYNDPNYGDPSGRRLRTTGPEEFLTPEGGIGVVR
jgi:hypothetical protein